LAGVRGGTASARQINEFPGVVYGILALREIHEGMW
jgi:hypothetical protein